MDARLLTGIVIGGFGLIGVFLGRTIYCAIKTNKAHKEFINAIMEGQNKLQETARKAGINLDEKIEK